ncbi:MAG: zinc ribbon domain-containing protein [Candidatus Humimicrobiaceae bacterium]
MFSKYKKKIHIILFIFLLIFIFGLYGCYDYSQYLQPIKELSIDLSVKSDGLADLALKILFDKNFETTYADTINQAKNSFESQGYKVEPYTSGDLDGFQALIPVNLLSKQDFSKIFNQDVYISLKPQSSESPLTIDKQFLYTYYRFSAAITSKGITSQSFTLTLPGEVTSNNADSVDKQKLTWNFSDSKTLEAESRVFNVYALILLVIIGLGVVIGFIFLIYHIGKPSTSAVSANVKYCPKCGNPVIPGSYFCKKCGKKL